LDVTITLVEDGDIGSRSKAIVAIGLAVRPAHWSMLESADQGWAVTFTLVEDGDIGTRSFAIIAVGLAVRPTHWIILSCTDHR